MQKWLTYLSKVQKNKTKVVPFVTNKDPIEECAKIRQQKMVPLEKSTKNHKQKWYHFRKVPKFNNKKGTIRVV